LDLRKLEVLAVMVLLPVFTGLAFPLNGYSTTENTTATMVFKDHPPHKYPDTEVIGNHHVTLFVDHTDGVIKVLISDANEKPYFLEKSFLKAIITNENGMADEIRLFPTQYARRRLYLGKETVRRWVSSKPGRRSKWVAHSSMYRYSADFLKSVHQFTMKLEVAIEKNPYIAKFEFEMPAEENAHHRH